jgi:beta-phosphoglucomutase-like phosphatase (HAD superfamily)
METLQSSILGWLKRNRQAAQDCTHELEAPVRAREFLMKLPADDIKLVVATSAGKDDVTLLLNRARVRDLIEETASSDDAERQT